MKDYEKRFEESTDRVADRASREFERASHRGVLRVVFGLFAMLIAIGLIGWGIFGIVGMFTATVGEAVAVAHSEIGPAALNAKYGWFKDALAALDSKGATIRELDGKVSRLRKDYSDQQRGKWASSDLTAMNQWEAERDGMIASYNGLAAEYNAAMSKWHTAFVNAGKVPAGGDSTLPREVRAYMTGTP